MALGAEAIPKPGEAYRGASRLLSLLGLGGEVLLFGLLACMFGRLLA